MKCEFCESLEIIKGIDAAFKRREAANGEEPLEHEYTVALVSRSWIKGRKRMAGRSVHFRHRGNGYRLNYCPSCGKKIGGRSEWSGST